LTSLLSTRNHVVAETPEVRPSIALQPEIRNCPSSRGQKQALRPKKVQIRNADARLPTTTAIIAQVILRYASFKLLIE
jgi:hypothetical protein